VSRFLTNIISRHIHAENTVRPRLRSQHEPRQAFSESFPGPGVGEATHDQVFPSASLIDQTAGEAVPVSPPQSAISSISPGPEAEAAFPIPQKAHKGHTGKASREISAEEPVRRVGSVTVTSRSGFFFVGKDSQKLQRVDIQQPEVHPGGTPKGQPGGVTEGQQGDPFPGKEGMKREAGSRQGMDALSAAASSVEAGHLQGIVKPRPRGKQLAGEAEQKAFPFGGIDIIAQVKPVIERRGMGKAQDQGVVQPIPPVIKIQIGRIEIKAVTEPAAKPVKARESARPGLTLDQFLRNKEGK